MLVVPKLSCFCFGLPLNGDDDDARILLLSFLVSYDGGFKGVYLFDCGWGFDAGGIKLNDRLTTLPKTESSTIPSAEDLAYLPST